MKINNLRSPRSGREVPNQYEIRDDEGNVFFQSYKTIIVKIDLRSGKTFLDVNSWDYSTTTGKYRNLFLGESKQETQRKIDNGTYQLVNLN